MVWLVVKTSEHTTNRFEGMKQSVAFMDTQRMHLLVMMSVVAIGVAATQYSCGSSSPCPPDKSFCTSAGCVYQCPDNSFINGTNCVRTCTNGVVDGTTCMEECPVGKNFTLERIELRNNKFIKFQLCLSSCNYYDKRILFEYNQTCVYRCPINASFVIGRTCSTACSDTLPLKYERLESQQSYVSCSFRCDYDKPFIRNNTCVAQCNAGEVLVGKMCFERCPNSSYFVFKNKCITQCPQNTFKLNTSCVDRCVSHNSSSSKYIFGKSCLDQCPEESNFFKNTTSGYVCVAKCDGNLLGRQCVDQCPSGTYLVNKSCVQTCPSSLPYMYVYTQRRTSWSSRSTPTIRECVSECPVGMFYNNLSCTKECHAKVLNRACVDACPNEFPYSSYVIGSLTSYTTYHNNPRCVKECPAQITVQLNFTCFRQCPHFSYNNVCITACPNATLKGNNICYDECPSTLYRYRNNCLSACPVLANIMFNRTCVTECPTGMYIDKYRYSFTHNTCFDECPNKLYSYKSQCVLECPLEANKMFNHTCLAECPTGTYTFQDKCVKKCPASTIYNDTGCIHCPVDYVIFNRTCVKNCPISMLKVDTNCVYACPNGTYYYNNECVSKCSKDTFEYKHMCFDKCPTIAPFKYISCKIKTCYSFDIHKKLCIEKCPDSFSLNFTCVESCPPNLIQYDSQCLDACPDGWFWWYTFTGPNGTCVSLWAIYGSIIGSTSMAAALCVCCTRCLRFRPCRSFAALLRSIQKTILNTRTRPENYELVPTSLADEDEEV